MSSARITLALALLFSTSALAQVDHRVQPGRPLPGHARDSNRLLGSGGFNTARQDYTLINSANAIVTGNVTGLGGFHSSSPFGVANPFNTTGISGLGSTLVSDPNRFGASLPSADLSYFDRRSYGVSDSLPGAGGGQNMFQTNPYYSTSDTVLNVGALRQGLNRPGSPTLMTPYTSLATPSAVGIRPTPLPTGINDPVDRRVQPLDSMTAPRFGTGQRAVVPTAPLGATAGGSAADSAYNNAMMSPLFGPNRPPIVPVGDVTQPRYSARVGDVPAVRSPAQPPALPTEPGATTAAPTGPGMAAREIVTTPAATVTPPTAAEAAPQRGVSTFDDLLAAVREASAIEPDFRRFLPPIGAAPAAPSADPGAPAAPTPPQPGAPEGPSVPQPGAAKDESVLSSLAKTAQMSATGRDGYVRDSEQARFAERLDRAARWAREMLERPVTTFAGAGGDPLNRYLREAEEALHVGQNYRAASRFSLAATIDPKNPLPLLGQGHALAAAGEYMSAVHHLVRGIARFPDIAAFRLDLVSLIGQKDVFDLRRADLETQLSRSESCELRFLLGYLEYYSGLHDVGLANLRRAAATAPPNSVIARFPDLLAGTGGAPPDQQSRASELGREKPAAN